MDGVQRVSTLYGALRATQNWTEFDDESDVQLRDFVVYADLDAEDEGGSSDRSTSIRIAAARSIPIPPAKYHPSRAGSFCGSSASSRTETSAV